MAISREQKEEQVAKLAEGFDRSQLTVLANYQGLRVAEMQELRRLLRDQQSTITVAKNSLIKLAASKANKLKDLDPNVFDGPMSLTFGYEDEVAAAKVLANFAKGHPALKISGGITADGQLMTAETVEQLASLPSKDELLGRFVGTLAAPLAGFVRVLAGNFVSLVNVLNNIKEQKT